MSFHFLFILFSVVCPFYPKWTQVEGMVITGNNYEPPSEWTYFAKFCYSNDWGGHGSLEYTIFTPSPTLRLAFYLGPTTQQEQKHGSWESVYEKHNELKCEVLVKMQSTVIVGGGDLGRVVSGEKTLINVSHATGPYFLYVAVADCEWGSIEMDSYQVSFLNPGGFWFKQFSYDEQGVVQYYIFFTGLYMILMIVHIWAVWQLARMEAWHPVVRTFSASISFQLIGCASQTIHYLVYLNNGVGIIGLKSLGELLIMISQLLLMFLCLLFAQGWAITSSRLPNKKCFIVTLVIFFLAYMALFIWDNAGRDPASTIYFYDSIPGLIVLLLRLGLTVFFLWSLRGTIKLEVQPDKHRFYKIFGFCFTIWFLLLPGIVTLALVLDPWYRFRTVQGLSLSSDALAFIAFIILLWPSRAVDFFDIKPPPFIYQTSYGSDQNL